MSDDLISRSELFKALFVHNGKVCPDNDIDNFPVTINVKDVKEAIRNATTAYDVDKVVERLICESINCHIMTDRAVEIVKSSAVE